MDAGPIFPDDIERAINQDVLDGNPDMWATMSAVASRFHTWTKPTTFSTVIISKRSDLTERIESYLLPNARFIRVLVIDTFFADFGELEARTQVLPAELKSMSDLLDASIRVRHLCVTWNIWTELRPKFGALRLESLYLRWDGALGREIDVPSLGDLQYPDMLKDLTVLAPVDLENPMPFRPWGQLLLPTRSQEGISLDYVTFASVREPRPGVENLGRKGSTLVLIRKTESSKKIFEYEVGKKFSIVYLRSAGELLKQWVERMEGRRTVLTNTVDSSNVTTA
ncbi:hypothetical protein C8R46DRAFT_1188296 [Mycena filopes]|nr:hypothetical protein C8R46DRAFT_1188296 [Mycena filopes]